MSECVSESGLQQICELSAFFICKSRILTVALRVFKVDFLMCHIEVAAYDYAFGPCLSFAFRLTLCHICI